MATRFDQMVHNPQLERMAQVDEGREPAPVNGEEAPSRNFRPDSPEAAMERLNARRKREGRPTAAELFERQQEQNIEHAADTARQLEGDEVPVDEPDEEIPADEDLDDDPELQEADAEDVDDEDADFEEDADPGDDEDATPRDAPRGWRDDSEAAEVFATLDPAIQDEIVRRADAAEAEYDRRFGELRQVEERSTQQARSTQTMFEGASRYLQTILQEDIPQEPSLDLLNPSHPDYNPEHHAILTHQHKAQVHRFNQRVAALKQMQADAQKRAEEQRAAAMEESERILFREFPDWLKDDGRHGQEELAKIKRSIVDRGVDPTIAENLHDATLIMIARDAMLWREHLKERKRRRKTVPKRVKKVQAAGRGRRGAAKGGAQSAKLAELRATAKATGDINDMAAYRAAKREASQQRG